MSLSTQRLPSFSSSSSTIPSTYDVFLSFCVEDTRNGFTDHLYAALKQRGLVTFRDDEKLQRGNDISQELLTAIRKSQYAVVVLSKNFASSSWCLRELTQIIECMREGRLKILPVFYHVDPSDVRKQTGIFAKAFDKHRENFKINRRQTKSHRTEMADCTVDPSDVRRQKRSFEEASNKHTDNPEVNRRQMKSRRTGLQEFVDCAVDPSDVRKLKRSFEEASNKHRDNPEINRRQTKSRKTDLKEFVDWAGDPSVTRNQEMHVIEPSAPGEDNPEADQEPIKSWRDALEEIVNLCGWHVNNSSEATVVQQIATKIFCGLRLNLSKMFKNLVGVESKMEELVSLLCLEKDDVRYIGIHGMGGVGKTTLAKVLYTTIRFQFEASCLISGTKNNQSRSIEDLQQEIIDKILKEHNTKVWNDYDGIELLATRLCNKKVLIVFDDINKKQLEALAGSPNWFDKGSRIVITSRDCQFWKPLVSHNNAYEVKLQNHKDALQLFCWNAFKSLEPEKNFVELSNKIIGYAGGLPLAIEVIGSSLVDKGMDVWNSICDYLEANPNAEVLDKLEISYNRLDDLSKELFLDIACFYNGMDAHSIISIWKSLNRHPEICIDILRHKSLLEFSTFHKFQMHDLLQKMGQRIVYRENSREPGKRSRLYCFNDIVHVLKNNSGTNAVKGIVLKFLSKRQELSFESFSNLTSLEILVIQSEYNFRLSEEGIVWSGCDSKLMLSDELRLLKWQDCPLPFFPRSFQLNNLVQLEMSFSHLKQLWHGRMYFKNLTYFNIKSEDLIEIPNLSGAPRLKEITFSGCKSLRKVHPSIGNLSQLQRLYLMECESLEELPKEFNLESLLLLDLFGCLRLKKLPDLSRVPHIENINLCYCKSLQELPPSIRNLKRLQSFHLSCCESLEKLPKKISWKSLKELYLGCPRMKKLPDLSGSPNISEIYLSNCESLKELHPCIGNLKRFQSLSLSFCKSLEELPEEINCEPLKELNLMGCLRLKKLPNLSGVPNIKRIHLSNCESLRKLHPSIGNLQQLQYLSLSRCISLKKISKEINCKSLEELYLNECLSLKKFPKMGVNTTALRIVDLRGTAIKRLPLSFQKLSSLEELLVGGTEAIQPPHNILCGCTGFCSSNDSNLPCFSVLNWLANFKFLRKLHLQYCNLSDESFPRDFSVTSIMDLNLSGNRFTKIPEFLNRFPKVENVELGPVPLGAVPRRGLNLNLSDCKLLDVAIWNDSLPAVDSLTLDENEFTRLTDNFCLLYNLKKLSLRKCRQLQALSKLPLNLMCLNVAESPLLEMIYDQRDMETSWEALDACVCLWFSAAFINGHDVTPYKIIQLQLPCPKVKHRWVQSTVSWGPTMKFEIPELFQQRSIGLYGEFQSRVNEDWLGYALFVVYEVHEHGFPEFVCQFHVDDNAQEQPLVLRVPEARSVGENGFWAFLWRDTFARAFPQPPWDGGGTKEYGFSIISNSLKAEIKECGARAVHSSEESQFFHVLRSISQHGLELKELKEFWFVLDVGWQSEK